MASLPRVNTNNRHVVWLFEQPLWLRTLLTFFSFLLATGIYFLGSAQPAWTHGFYVPIVVGAALLGYPGFVLTVLASGAVIGPLFPPVQEIGSPEAMTNWFFRFFFYFLVGGTVTTLFGLAERSLMRARELNQSLMVEKDKSAQRVQELESLRELDRVILGNGEMEHMLMVVLQTMASLRGARRAVYWRLDQEKGILIPETAVGGLPIEGLRDYLAQKGGVRLGELGVGWAILQGTTTVVQNARSDPRYARFQDIPELFGYTSAIAAPVTIGGRTFGGLTVTFGEDKELTEDDIRIVSILANQIAIGLQNLEQRQQLQNLVHQSIAALGEAIEARDPYTGGHCHRLAGYSLAIAQELSLPTNVQERIRFAAYLHDVGKVGIPDAILKKPGPLTPQEFTEIKQHPYIGSQIVKRMPMLSEIVPLVYHHHERYDGSGYPDGIVGRQIPIEDRIIAVADAFDAMTNDRPYRNARDTEAAFQELIQGKGTQFDPQVVDAFLTVMEKGWVGGAHQEIA